MVFSQGVWIVPLVILQGASAVTFSNAGGKGVVHWRRTKAHAGRIWIYVQNYDNLWDYMVLPYMVNYPLVI